MIAEAEVMEQFAQLQQTRAACAHCGTVVGAHRLHHCWTCGTDVCRECINPELPGECIACALTCRACGRILGAPYRCTYCGRRYCRICHDAGRMCESCERSSRGSAAA